MTAMTKKISNENAQRTWLFGMFSTLLFIVFAVIHISLSLDQYNVGNMNKLNRSVTLASLPQLDDQIPLTPK